MPQSKTLKSAQSESELSKYLCFLLGGRYYGIDIGFVKEIIEYVEMTPIPRMPEFLRGAINLRNQVIPVVDLSQLLGSGLTDIVRRTCIIRCEIGLNGHQFNIGLLVDSVNQVADIAESSIESAPSFAGTLNTRFIKGIVNLGEQFTILLDLGQIFSANELTKLVEFYDRDSVGMSRQEA